MLLRPLSDRVGSETQDRPAEATQHRKPFPLHTMIPCLWCSSFLCQPLSAFRSEAPFSPIPAKTGSKKYPKWTECGTLGNVFDLQSKGLGESNLGSVVSYLRDFRQVIYCKSYLFFGPQFPKLQNVQCNASVR